METILDVNAGSSSLKFQVFAVGGSQGLNCLVRGQPSASLAALRAGPRVASTAGMAIDLLP